MADDLLPGDEQNPLEPELPDLPEPDQSAEKELFQEELLSGLSPDSSAIPHAGPESLEPESPDAEPLEDLPALPGEPPAIESDLPEFNDAEFNQDNVIDQKLWQMDTQLLSTEPLDIDSKSGQELLHGDDAYGAVPPLEQMAPGLPEMAFDDRQSPKVPGEEDLPGAEGGNDLLTVVVEIRDLLVDIKDGGGFT